MDLDLQWLLLGLPLAFALGWMASRLDLRQQRRDSNQAPKAYFQGLNLLLNEQQDKAIDAFIEAVQHDPDTAELHFALGNLFRRRGEFERAVRVHEHLLSRADLKAADRERAQQALAQDFMKAGLFDRAESAWRALEGSSYDAQARAAELTLAERSRDWPRAIELARGLEAQTPASHTIRLAHYECELALQADAAGQSRVAQAALARAVALAPQAARPLLQMGQHAWQAGLAAQACAAWQPLLDRHEPRYVLVVVQHAQATLARGDALASQALQQALRRWLALMPSVDVQEALLLLEGEQAPAATAWTEQLQRRTSLGAAQRLLSTPPQAWGDSGLQALRQAVAHAAKPMQRYRCASCAFEAQNYFWQCPGCLAWESYPPQRLDEMV